MDFTRFYDRLPDDLLMFAPELVLCSTIVALLFARLLPFLDRVHLMPLAAIGCVVALCNVVVQWITLENGEHSAPKVFSDLLYMDNFAAFFRAFVLVGTLLILILGRLTRVPDRLDSADFSVLLLGAALGMMLMASANHLLMMFIAVEMASLPSYALAGFLKGKSRSSEAALKYVVYGAASSGLMLYGISLVVSLAGSGSYVQFTHAVGRQIQSGSWDATMVIGVVFIFVGLGFKLSAVPFHVWLPDVFEGAAAEVAAFLSVVSKAGAFALWIRFVQRIVMAGHEVNLPDKVEYGLGLAILIAAGVTATLGNFLAYAQKSLPRVLAYSTIAHAGYMLMALGTMTAMGFEAVLVYLVAYMLANIGAFAVVAFVRNATGRDDVYALNGLMVRSPVLGVCLVVFVISLLGLPPTAGFMGKFLVFSAAMDAKAYWVLAVGVVNTVISAGYYLRLLKVAGLDAAENKEALSISSLAKGYVLILAGLTVLVGLYWPPILSVAKTAVGIVP